MATQGAHDDELAPDEPTTPLWLTLLGIGLFLLAGIYFLVAAPESPDARSAVTAADAGAAAAEDQDAPP